ncbi:MAG: DUF2344 domain-containing protein [Synergistaceae bacterium]|nr:DUF2344 domain-containing protein [Synergistaceae bacterium]
MPRARLIYSKRGGACFVPHIALAQIFSRSARRAGFSLTMTQGFSPRAKLSFGPELPAGVVALNEPADLYFAEDYSDILEGLNSALPEGFRVSRVMFPPEDSPSLGKSCKHAEYFVRSVNGSELHDLAKNFYAEALRFCEVSDGWLRLILADPSQNPIGGWVRSLIDENIISGWHEINIVRAAVGIYDEEKGGVFMNA